MSMPDLGSIQAMTDTLWSPSVEPEQHLNWEINVQTWAISDMLSVKFHMSIHSPPMSSSHDALLGLAIVDTGRRLCRGVDDWYQHPSLMSSTYASEQPGRGRGGTRSRQSPQQCPER